MRWVLTDSDTGAVLHEVEMPRIRAGRVLRELGAVYASLGLAKIRAAEIEAFEVDAGDFGALAKKCEMVARLKDLTDGTKGVALALVLGHELGDAPVLWQRGLPVWERLIEEGWTSAELDALFHAVRSHHELVAFGGVAERVGLHVSDLAQDSAESTIQRALWAISAEKWGSTDAWREQDPEEVSRLVGLRVTGALGALRGD